MYYIEYTGTDRCKFGTLAVVLCIYALSILQPETVASQNNSLNSGSDIAEIILGESTISIPTEKGLFVSLKGQGWSYSNANAIVANNDIATSLATIEDSATSTRFTFYRMDEGEDEFNFSRIDYENNLQYTYYLGVEWKDNYTPEHATVLQDDFVSVELMYEGMDDYAQSLSKQAEANNESTSMTNTANGSASSNSKPNNKSTKTNNPLAVQADVSSTKASTAKNSSVPTSSSANTIPSNTSAISPRRIDTLSKNLSSSIAPLDEGEIISNDIAMNASANITGLPNTLGTELLDNIDAIPEEASTKPVEEMSFEELKTYISNNWDKKEFDLLNSEIISWSNSNNNMFNSASIIWHYGQLIESKLTHARDVQRVYALYKTIVDDYPLSLEYYQAQNAIESLKKHYMFILE